MPLCGSCRVSATTNFIRLLLPRCTIIAWRFIFFTVAVILEFLQFLTNISQTSKLLHKINISHKWQEYIVSTYNYTYGTYSTYISPYTIPYMLRSTYESWTSATYKYKSNAHPKSLASFAEVQGKNKTTEKYSFAPMEISICVLAFAIEFLDLSAEFFKCTFTYVLMCLKWHILCTCTSIRMFESTLELLSFNGLWRDKYLIIFQILSYFPFVYTSIVVFVWKRIQIALTASTVAHMTKLEMWLTVAYE